MHTLITAHAGAENTKANTIESLRYLAAIGADAVEIDVREKDGVLLLSHNELTEGEDYALFSDAACLIAAQPELSVNIDLKTEELLPAAYRAAEEARLHGRYLFTGSVSEKDAAYALRHGAPVWYNGALLTEEEKADPMSAVERRGFSVLNTYYGEVTDEVLAQYAGRLSLWTVDEESLLERYLKAGCLSVTTRRPLLAMRLREKIQDMRY